MSEPIVYRCPAKVNLALSVGAPRPDGFHPIASWMVAINLYDDLEVTAAPPADVDQPSVFDVAWAADAPCPSPIDWAIESDLVYRAHALLEHEAGQPLPIHCKVRKRIPVGAGLAGGSSNGATMLMTLDEMFELGIDQERLIELTGELGSDLAFFFSDGSAVVTGRGETLQPAPLDEPLHLCLIAPPFGCNTGAVYRAFDDLHPDARVDEASVLRAVAGKAECFNDLAEAACAVQPQLSELRALVAEITGRPVHVTGSGSGMFIVARHDDDAADLAQQIKSATDVAAMPVATIA